MKYLLAALFSLTFWFCEAQHKLTVNYVSDNVSGFLHRYRSFCKVNDLVDGYRIQLSSTEDRTEAYNKKSKLYSQIPDLKSYVSYEQPYFKIRIGDFENRLEATKWLMEVIKIYPEAFIVKDRIKIK